MKKLAIAVSFITITLLGCQPTVQAKTITVKGSDTMVILGQRWAEAYMKNHPGAIIQVTGGGTGTGIAALINGSTDIAEASRPMKQQEKDQAKARHGKEVAEIPVALDGLTIYVHQNSSLEKISLTQVKAIYTGALANWQQLGGPSSPIIAYGRENNSGTYAFFKEHVLMNEDFAPEVLSLPGTAAVINAVSKDTNAIGYGGIAYAKGAKTLAVSKDANSPAFKDSMENVASGKYPLSRNLYFYTLGQPSGEVKAFVDWVLSTEGQIVCKEVGYYPLTKKLKK